MGVGKGSARMPAQTPCVESPPHRFQVRVRVAESTWGGAGGEVAPLLGALWLLCPFLLVVRGPFLWGTTQLTQPRSRGPWRAAVGGAAV